MHLRRAARALALAAPQAAEARKRAPELDAIRCVPATSATCKTGVKVTIGRQLQFSGRRIYKGMRVSFRWPRGALATKLDRTRVGYVARVPAGTRAGTVSRDRLRPRRPALERAPDHGHRAAAGRRPDARAGHAARGLPRQRHVDLGAEPLRGRRRRPRSPPAPARPGSPPSSSRARTAPTSRWAQFNPAARRRPARATACAPAPGSSSTATTRSARPASAPTRSPTAPTAS